MLKPFTASPQFHRFFARGRSDASPPVHPAYGALLDSPALAGLTGEERRRIGVLLGVTHFDMSERARLVFEGMQKRAPHVTTQQLRDLLASPKILPSTADLYSRLRARIPALWTLEPAPGSRPGDDQIDLRVGDRAVRLTVPPLAPPVEPAGRARPPFVTSPRLYSPSRSLVGQALSLLPAEALSVLDRVKVSRRSADGIGRYGMPRLAAYADRELTIYPQALPGSTDVPVALLADAALYELCRGEAVNDWGRDCREETWTGYRQTAKADVVAPSTGALDDLACDFGESRALFFLSRGQTEGHPLAALFPARWAFFKTL